MLEHRLGQEQLLQVLNKLLSLANNARTVKGDTKAWSSMVWNTNTFTKSIFTVTGKDMMVFMDQGVRRVRKYVGPVKVALQELDGQFPHTFQVSAANRLIGEVVQSWRRPLLGPSPG